MSTSVREIFEKASDLSLQDKAELASLLLEPSAELLPEKHCVTKRWFGRGILFSLAGLVGIKYATQLLGLAGI